MSIALAPGDLKIFAHFDGDDFDKEAPPLSVNYVNGLDVRLEPIMSMIRGRVTRVEFHAAAALDGAGEKVGSDLVVSEDFVYQNDAAGLARARTQTITWYRSDGQPCAVVKSRVKLYNNTESRSEGRRRRRNIVDSLSIKVVGMLAATETAGDVGQAIAIGTSYMAALELEVAKYIELSDKDLADTIATDLATTWLNNLVDASGGRVRDVIALELA